MPNSILLFTFWKDNWELGLDNGWFKWNGQYDIIIVVWFMYIDGILAFSGGKHRRY